MTTTTNRPAGPSTPLHHLGTARHALEVHLREHGPSPDVEGALLALAQLEDALTAAPVPGVLIHVDGGLVQGVSGTDPRIGVRVLDFDREGEDRGETARWLWENRDVLRPTGGRTSRHSAPGDASNDYAVRDGLYPHPLY
jgi:hypothetical protein